MSLLFSQMEACAFLDRTAVPDGVGGLVTEWREGRTFRAAVAYDNSAQTRTAEAEGVKGKYTVIVPAETRMDYHAVFKRMSDGRTFRCVSKDDRGTPDTASFRVRQSIAEEWNPT